MAPPCRIWFVACVCAWVGCDGGDQSGGELDATLRDAKVELSDGGAGVDAATGDARLDAAASEAGADAFAPDARIDASPSDTGVDTTDDDAGSDADVSDACAQSTTCPPAAVDKVTVCGRLYDVETETEIRAAVPKHAACGSGAEAEDGPCELSMLFYDATAFAMNPGATAPLAVQALELDDCGRYVAENVDLPAFGFLAVAVDDAATAPDDHRLTVESFPVTSGQRRENQKSYVVRRSTDLGWSADAGLGVSTFVDLGALMSIFLHGTSPVAGVTVTSDGSARAGDDYYFTDTDSNLRADVTATGPTQANGAALLLNSALVDHSGLGGEPPGCVWPSAPAVTVPGVLWMVPQVAELSGGGACP